MENIAAIRRLLEFQRINGGAMTLLMNFIAEDTVKDFAPIGLFLNVVRNNGAIFIPFVWGENSHIPQDGPERIVDIHTPGYDAYVNGKLVEAGKMSEYHFYNSEKALALFPNGFQASWIIPVPKFGALLLFCEKKLPRTVLVENFLFTLGEILSFNLTHGDHGVQFEKDPSDPEPVAQLPLTPRQWAIKDAMIRGLTNGAIAREMNFSESLIRHETIRIYSKLGINGRKDLFVLGAEEPKERN